MSTAADIDVSYGVSNDFYQLWLDRSMTYTCALFASDDDTLENAQTHKHEYHYRAARIGPQSRVLDIGCGWGSNLEFLAAMGVKHTVGITISRDQMAYIRQRALPNVEAKLVSYEHFIPERPFDAVVSIGMFEHIATPEEARAGRHIEKYRRYFEHARRWTRPGAWFSLQSVVGSKIPRGQVLRDLAWTTQTIFPGAITPRLESIVQACHPHWEVVELHTRREHYARTTAEWLKRLRANEAAICDRWSRALFQTYERYLATCVLIFGEGYQSLAQLALRRVD